MLSSRDFCYRGMPRFVFWRASSATYLLLAVDSSFPFDFLAFGIAPPYYYPSFPLPSFGLPIEPQDVFLPATPFR